MLKIKNIELANHVLLAPLAGVTDVTYRTICKQFGIALTFTEMISAKGLRYENEKTKELLKTSEIERPVGVQLFGKDPALLAEEAEKLQETFDLIDINMGCPVPKVVKNGEGSALLREPELVRKIVRAVVDRVHIPVCIKIRKGFAAGEENAILIAKIAESEGASMITVHGRTREQYYSGKVDLEMIKQVKQAVKIPVIGNGDIFTRQDANRMMEATGCDGIMLARGVLGNPWLIQEILEEKEIKVTKEMKIKMALCQTRMLIEEKGEERGMVEMRKHILWYMKNIPNGAKIRQEISKVCCYQKLEEMLYQI